MDYIYPDQYVIEEVCYIGRSASSNVIVDSVLASKYHAEIIIDNGHCYIIDDCSTNGVFINQERIKPKHRVRLRSNDTIGIGANIPMIYYVNPDSTIGGSLLIYDQIGCYFTYCNEVLELTQSERDLLLAIYVKEGRICLYDECVEAVWKVDVNTTYYHSNQRSNYHTMLHRKIRDIRRKLESIYPGLWIINTRNGLGYYLDASKMGWER